MIFLAQIVLVKQSPSDALNADRNSLCILFFNRARCQCPRLSTWFQLGSLPVTISVRLPVVGGVGCDGGSAGMRKEASDLVRVHLARIAAQAAV